MKKSIFFMLVVFVILINSLSVFAQNETESTYDKIKALDWLSAKLEANDWNYAVETISWSVLALAAEGYDYSNGVSKLKSIERSDNSWGADVFETSLAILALHRVGEDVSSEVEWLLEQQKTRLTGGRWLLQFNPLSQDISGNCRLVYGNNEVMVDINGYNITPPSGCLMIDDSWIDFELCLKGTNPEMYEEIFVDCSSPSGQISSSLLYKIVASEGNSYYVMDETYQDQYLEIRNGCYFGNTVGCNCDYTGYAAWTLKNLNEELNFYGFPYLKSKCNDNVLNNVFLYLLTSGTSYLTWFEQTDNPYRNNDGSWSVQVDGGADLSKTAMVVLSLKGSYSGSALQAVQWLKNKQRITDGSWDQNPKLTAQVLYALSSGFISTPSGDSLCGDGITEGNEQCESTLECSGIDSNLICSNNCMCVQAAQNCADLGVGECVPGIFECSSGSCNPVTCLCEDEDDVWSTTDSKELDEEADVSWLKWLIILLVILGGVAGVYFIYIKFFKGKNIFSKLSKKVSTNRTTQKTMFPKTPQRVPIRRPEIRRDRIETKTEKELDEALKKAKDLLKK